MVLSAGTKAVTPSAPNSLSLMEQCETHEEPGMTRITKNDGKGMEGVREWGAWGVSGSSNERGTCGAVKGVS